MSCAYIAFLLPPGLVLSHLSPCDEKNALFPVPSGQAGAFVGQELVAPLPPVQEPGHAAGGAPVRGRPRGRRRRAPLAALAPAQGQRVPHDERNPAPVFEALGRRAAGRQPEPAHDLHLLGQALLQPRPEDGLLARAGPDRARLFAGQAAAQPRRAAAAQPGPARLRGPRSVPPVAVVGVRPAGPKPGPRTRGTAGGGGINRLDNAIC